MVPGEAHLFPAARAIELGLPPVGFRFRPIEGLVVTDLAPSAAPGEGGGAVVRVDEREPTGRMVGAIELGVFGATLVIDRAGVLCDLARASAAKVLGVSARGRLLGEGEMELAGGASGYRIDVVLQLDQDGLIRPECPYASWLALAGEDAVVPGGVLAVVRSAGPIWRAAIGLLNSLEILGPSRVSSRPSGSSARTSLLDLPLVRRR